MQRIIVQIYEVQTPSEAERLSKLDVDHIGSVVLSENNWKLPQLKETIQTIESTTAKSSLIPLYHNQETILRTLEYYQPDIVHFCEALVGERNLWNFCDKLIRLQLSVKKHFPQIKIMRSIPIGQSGGTDQIPTLRLAQQFEASSDFFLTDTFLGESDSPSINSQPVQGFVGITGKICDWETAQKLVETSCLPVILAGGISPQNVLQGIRHVKPAGIDSCTQTNLRDQNGAAIRFKKDFNKVKQLVEKVRKFEKEIII